MSFCSKFLLVLAVVLIPLIAFLSQSDHYLLGLLRIIWRANREVILPPQPVHWTTTSQTPRRGQVTPNILFILADDLGFNDLSGGAGVATPHIDSLATNGVHLTQAYASHATCAPSRAAILTGRIPTKMGFEFTPTPKFFGKLIGDMTTWNKIDFPPVFRHELYQNAPNMDDLFVPKNYTMLPEMLAKLDFASYHLGKWDSGFKNEHGPITRGYNESLNFLLGSGPYGSKTDPSIINAKGIPMDMLLLRVTNCNIQHNNGPRFLPDKYMTDYLSEKAVELIHTAHGPWHISVSYNAPHNPFQASVEDFNHPDLAHLEHNPRVYASMIRALDRGVGQMLNALKASGQWDNTLVVFTSDNGGAFYASMAADLNHPFRGYKATFFEGGLRAPTFMQWPAKLAAGSVFDQPMMSVDFVPTFIAAANGLDNPAVQQMLQGVDGVNLLPALLEKAALPERALFWRCGEYRALRKGDIKLMTHITPDKVWYYHLDKDPHEHVNLAERLNITSRTQLIELHAKHEQLCGTSRERTDTTDTDGLLCELLSTYSSLLHEERQQLPAQWVSLSSVAICIDHLADVPCKHGEEYIYFDN